MTTEKVSYFRLAEQARKSGDRSWIECTQEHYDYCLRVLPPIYLPGCFAVSEPIRYHNPAKSHEQEYHCCRYHNHGYQCREAAPSEIRVEADRMNAANAEHAKILANELAAITAAKMKWYEAATAHAADEAADELYAAEAVYEKAAAALFRERGI